jgi:hypothetical protein
MIRVVDPESSANGTILRIGERKKYCHPERSEGSRRMNEILRCAQDDN